jgi:hypothetical protein
MAIAAARFSTFFEKPFVGRVKRRIGFLSAQA